MTRRWLTNVRIVALIVAVLGCGGSVREETHRYRHTPQRDVDIVLHLPRDLKPGDTRPAIVFFYGGGFERRRINHFRRQADYFASRGMVAARADTRLVTDAEDIRAEDAIGDAQAAVAWLRANAGRFGVDTTRVIVAGGSAGGLLAASTGDVPASEAPCLLVLINPVLEQTDPEKIDRRWRSAESAAWYAPLRNIHSGIPPTILFFGTDDPYADAGREYASRARELGVDVRLYLAEGEDHGFFNRKAWRNLTLDVLDARLAADGILLDPPPPRTKSGGVRFSDG